MKYNREQVEIANQRGAERLSKIPTATRVHYDRRRGSIVIDLSNGTFIGFHPRSTQGFERAKPGQLTQAEISPSGLGIYFPLIDADIYLPGLLQGFLGSQRWMAAQLGKTGGSVVSSAKIFAARENGKLGGRPKKAQSVHLSVSR